ncbi:hypothetical protein DH2020_018860 [Rehmannia glutinosa]|uniref:RBR-type E3 ubiquitin transferase n=1 Tax=Rehmannia glutinosa TaxID=99300 RepID=A0ABR0WM66_REHGL
MKGIKRRTEEHSPSSPPPNKCSKTEKFSKNMDTQSVAALSRDDFSLHFLIDRSKKFQDDDDDDMIIMSDAKYAEELIFQEALMASFINPTTPLPINDDSAPENQVFESSSQKGTMEIGESSSSSSSSSSDFLCEICAETKENDQIFAVQKCNHKFCTECIAKHIAVKIQKTPISENARWFSCPGLDCEGVLEIETCLNIVPKEVLSMWGDAICESMISASQKFYCPYKDCSALLENDGEVIIRESECPFCRRLFCAQCKVPWHSGVGCDEFWKLSESERGREDLMVHELAKLKKWQRCPQCKFFVDKMEGCLHMTCSVGVDINFVMHAEQNGDQFTMKVASDDAELLKF